jgi:hypothetical protein
MRPNSGHDWGESRGLTMVGGTHYTDLPIQPWEAMQAWMPKEAFVGFLEGNALKYLARWRAKGGVEDIRKAQHYLAKLEEVLAPEQNTHPTEKN